ARYSLAPGCACSPVDPCSPSDPGAGVCSAISSSLLQQIDQGEDRHPHHVDEVPVKTADLDVERALLRQLAAHRHDEQSPQPDHADRDVGAMESGQHVERAAEQIRLELEAL